MLPVAQIFSSYTIIISMEKCVFGLEMFSMGLQISKSTFEVVEKQKILSKAHKIDLQTPTVAK